MKNNFHILKPIRNIKIDNNFIFVDAESNIDKSIQDTEILTFKMCSAIFWNRDIDKKVSKIYYNQENFWYDVDKLFNKERNQYTLFAHNTQFDMNQLVGFEGLAKLGWKLEKQYIRNRVFIVVYKKEGYTLRIYDTYNYIPMSLDIIGKSLNFPKLKINFDNCTKQELDIYCMRDTEIIFKLIKKLLNFLEIHDLSSLKPTIGSLAMSSFKHKFYNPIKNKDNTQIAIHDFKQAIKLERDSYRGGITDCFAIGKYKKAYKVDINSMYPYEMKENKVPIRLELFTHESINSQKELFFIYNHYKNNYGFIMDITVDLPKENAYILNKFKDKCRFCYGKFRITLCEPEIRFIEKYGKILHIHRLSMYKMSNIFKDYVNFFNDLKIKYGKENNKAFRMFAKYFMNTLYGKFAQRKLVYRQIKLTDKDIIYHMNFIIDLIKEHKDELDNNKPIIYLGHLVNHFELYIIDKKLWLLKETTENDKDTFVAISSFITSYSRMLLIDYLKIAKRKNCYYSDTDSFILNRKGVLNLYNNNCIDDYELGKIKNEGFGTTNIYKPKFYDFNNHRKCKGIRKDSELLLENHIKAVYKVAYWYKWKTNLKESTLDKQIIKYGKKEVLKNYDKGKILDNNRVEAFHISELEQYT